MIARATGFGTTAATRGLVELLSGSLPRAIVFGGIAGTVDRSVQPGAVVALERAIYYDRDTRALRRPCTHTYASALDRSGYEEIFAPTRVLAGTITTGDSFLDRELFDALPRPWREVIERSCAVDMESAAWAETAQTYAVPWVGVRVVSDHILLGTRTRFGRACRLAGQQLTVLAAAAALLRL